MVEDESTNPLTSPKGFWNLEEFLLMVAGMHYLAKRELWKEFESLSNGFGFNHETLEELTHVFANVDQDANGKISLQEFQKLLMQADLSVTDKELKVLLGTQNLEDELTFSGFVRAMTKVEDFLQLAGKPNSVYSAR